MIWCCNTADNTTSFAICFKLLHGCAGSISYNSWIPAEVLGWNSELHCYILNIQAVAAPHKVRCAFFFSDSTNGGDVAEMTQCDRMFGFGKLCKTSRWGRRRVSRAPHLSKWRHKWILFTIDMLPNAQKCLLACSVSMFAKEPCICTVYIYGVHMCHNLNASGSSLCAGYVALRVAFGAEARRGGGDLDPKKSAFSHDSHRQSISKSYEIHINSEKNSNKSWGWVP